jgi:hypothetical protein
MSWAYGNKKNHGVASSTCLPMVRHFADDICLGHFNHMQLRLVQPHGQGQLLA